MTKKNEKDIDELISDNRRHKVEIVILIIIIILLLFFIWFLGYKLGKIGYETSNNNTNIVEPVSNDIPLKMIRVSDDKGEIDENTELDIFANELFNYEKKIAPHSKGVYKFYVKNVGDSNLSYNIKFSDSMTNPVNMKYRLKIDNVYIRGNSENYVDLSEMNTEEIVVQKGSNNIFTIEWYWADDDTNDTYTGSLDNQYYNLNLTVSVNE